MRKKIGFVGSLTFRLCLILFLVAVFLGTALAGDLPDVKKRGVLRHLGIPYANFVTGSGDGLDVELMKLFAKHLNVKYAYVKTDWDYVMGDLTGKKVIVKGEEVEFTQDMPIKGDVIACGMTWLPWRQKVVDYSLPTFPTQVWLVARADSPLKPIVPSRDLAKDITVVREKLKGHAVLGKANTCLDPKLNRLEETGADVKVFKGGLNELAPAIINGEAETTILDVPDALIALEKWPGKVKVIGPVSPVQEMGCGFAKTSPSLRQAFNDFYKKLRKDGTYRHLVEQYYPAVFAHYPEFFKEL